MDAQQLQSLVPALEAHIEGYSPCFKRSNTFRHFRSYLLGLMADLDRKSIEPIALATGTAVRTLQEFLAFFVWDHARMDRMLLDHVAGRCPEGGIGIIDGSGHAKRGDKTPGVQRQYCGETGKVDNCVIGQHLLFTDNHPSNPFCCMLQSDLYLPKGWSEDRPRCQEAGIPDTVVHQPRWKTAVQQTKNAIGCGVKFKGVVFDEEYGQVPDFWLEMDQMGLWATGEVPCNFRAWTKRPACRSTQACHASKRVDHLTGHSSVFLKAPWNNCTVKEATRGPVIWRYKAARVHLAVKDRQQDKTVPTDRQYWLIKMHDPATAEIKYVISNAPESVSPEECIKMLLSRWHIEKWFERAKQEAGMGAFEVRNYTSLIRHWLCVRIAMCFLSEQTTRLRGEKSAHHVRTDDSCCGDDRHRAMAAGLPYPTVAA